MGNEDHCDSDSNSHCIQFIRWEKKTTVIPILSLSVFNVSGGKQVPLSYSFKLSRCSAYPLEKMTTAIPILILTVFSVFDSKRWPLSYWFELSLCSVYPMGNEGLCHSDSNFQNIRYIRWETRTTVTPILTLTVFNVSDGKRRPLSTDSKYHCIQSIRWKTGTTILLIPILTVFRVSVGNYDNCHADSNSQYIQCIRWEKMTTVTPILILTVLSVSNSKRWPLSYRF